MKMAKLAIDTQKLKIEGDNLKELSSNYKQIIDDIIELINNLSKSNAWIVEKENGSIKIYAPKVMKYLISMQNLSKNIDNLGDAIIEYSDNLNNISDKPLQEVRND